MKKDKRKKAYLVFKIILLVLITFAIGTLYREILLEKSTDKFAIVFLIITIVFLIVLLGILHFRESKENESNVKYAELQNEYQNVQLQKKQEQLNALQNQINPHFLYNTLDTIRGMSIEQGNDQVAHIVEMLSSMFKYSINYADSLVSIMDEVSHIHRYIEILNIRTPGRAKLEEIYQCDLNELQNVLIPKLILQPLIENAVQHGFKDKVNGIITIRYISLEKDFEIVLSDNGKGIDEKEVLRINRSLNQNDSSHIDNNLSSSGIALSNINSRIKLYFGEDYGLHLISTVNYGTEITIRIPRQLKHE